MQFVFVLMLEISLRFKYSLSHLIAIFYSHMDKSISWSIMFQILTCTSCFFFLPNGKYLVPTKVTGLRADKSTNLQASEDVPVTVTWNVRTNITSLI